jgi:hypothetical protein
MKTDNFVIHVLPWFLQHLTLLSRNTHTIHIVSTIVSKASEHTHKLFLIKVEFKIWKPLFKWQKISLFCLNQVQYYNIIQSFFPKISLNVLFLLNTRARWSGKCIKTPSVALIPSPKKSLWLLFSSHYKIVAFFQQARAFFSDNK